MASAPNSSKRETYPCLCGVPIGPATPSAAVPWAFAAEEAADAVEAAAVEAAAAAVGEAAARVGICCRRRCCCVTE